MMVRSKECSTWRFSAAPAVEADEEGEDCSTLAMITGNKAHLKSKHARNEGETLTIIYEHYRICYI